MVGILQSSVITGCTPWGKWTLKHTTEIWPLRVWACTPLHPSVEQKCMCWAWKSPSPNHQAQRTCWSMCSHIRISFPNRKGKNEHPSQPDMQFAYASEDSEGGLAVDQNYPSAGCTGLGELGYSHHPSSRKFRVTDFGSQGLHLHGWRV